jgi:hypothetical protein
VRTRHSFDWNRPLLLPRDCERLRPAVDTLAPDELEAYE